MQPVEIIYGDIAAKPFVPIFINSVAPPFTPVNRELFPGHPFPERPAWSEVRYTAYSYVMPKAP